LSTISKHSTPRSLPIRLKTDPYRHGWRFVRVPKPDRAEALDQVALKLKDVRHPEQGNTIVQTDAHDSDRAYLNLPRFARSRREQVGSASPAPQMVAGRGI
jgi:hypothetical protein